MLFGFYQEICNELTTALNFIKLNKEIASVQSMEKRRTLISVAETLLII